jgi:sterol desaturase/sphingolipid hydroxylase (fatty acid hydroxylase superfamily)
MEADAIRAAIPFFFALIFVERLAGGTRLYRLNDSLSNLSAGIGQQVLSIPLTALLVWIYAWLFKTTALMSWPANSFWSWVAAFVLVDFAYYWFHRASHRVSFIWAAHIVHHQSEEYNLTVALSQSWIQSLFTMFFYLPLATLGFPTEVALGAIALSAIGQFWFHTRAVGRLGFLESFLNTPSHHRSASRSKYEVSRQELRRGIHRLGPALWNIHSRRRRAGIRHRQTAQQLERRLGEYTPLVRTGAPLPIE